MKKHTEKQPIDDLFARKLENMSLPPTPDGFDRLQARIRQNKPEMRVVFWRDPAMQRYMAAAACLLVVFLFGWLYWPSGAQETLDHPQVATNQNAPLRVGKTKAKQSDQLTSETITNEVTQADLNQEQVALGEKETGRSKLDSRPINQPVGIKNVTMTEHHSGSPERSEFVAAQTKTAESKVDSETTPVADVTPVGPPVPDQVAVIDKKTAVAPEATTERVLVVTIDEPATLVAARQAAQASVDEKVSVAVNAKPEKEPKHGGLWQQVKRIREGEVFARRDNADNDERGLLSRAYNGLKHSLDKDKSTKQ